MLEDDRVDGGDNPCNFSTRVMMMCATYGHKQHCIERSCMYTLLQLERNGGLKQTSNRRDPGHMTNRCDCSFSNNSFRKRSWVSHAMSNAVSDGTDHSATFISLKNW